MSVPTSGLESTANYTGNQGIFRFDAETFSFIYSLYIPMYVLFCRSELCSRFCEKTLTLVNENQNQNRKLNPPGCQLSVIERIIASNQQVSLLQ